MLKQFSIYSVGDRRNAFKTSTPLCDILQFWRKSLAEGCLSFSLNINIKVAIKKQNKQKTSATDLFPLKKKKEMKDF